MIDPAPKLHPRAGLLDHCGSGLGGAQLVLGHMAAALARRFNTEILHFQRDAIIPKLERAFSLDLSSVTERRISRGQYGFGIPGAHGFMAQIRANARNLTAPYDLFVYSGHGVPPFCYARCGLVYSHFPVETSPVHGVERNGQWHRRIPLDRLLRLCLHRWLWRKRMRGYSCVMTNSAYSARWIERRWGIRPEVVYPPVDLTVPTVAKQDDIVSVGRFTSGHRSKHQLAQVLAFREFARCAPGWRLVLAGSCSDGRDDEAYLESVKRTAAGLPVQFLVNVERGEILRALAQAKLFWHTTGLSINEDEQPALAEHFGIATVEAMRAGCVPIVIASGGQREIIEEGRTGFLVSRASDELVERSLQLARDSNMLVAMSQLAQRHSTRFSREAFEQRILECLKTPPEVETALPQAACIP